MSFPGTSAGQRQQGPRRPPPGEHVLMSPREQKANLPTDWKPHLSCSSSDSIDYHCHPESNEHKRCTPQMQTVLIFMCSVVSTRNTHQTCATNTKMQMDKKGDTGRPVPSADRAHNIQNCQPCLHRIPHKSSNFAHRSC